MIQTVRIATRKSPLALWQAEHVAMRLRTLNPGLVVELITMMTQGDKILDTPLAKIGGKGLFVKELEQGMLNGLADIAVHSMKDVPMELPDGLHIGAILSREDPRDAFVSDRFECLDQLPLNARIGTSSLRRQCQIKRIFPDCEIIALRGNVGTRLEKLKTDNLDAIILASAGLKRLELAHRITRTIEPEICLPAVGQGAIGIECRVDDILINNLIKPLADDSTTLCVEAERSFNKRLNGGCQVPIAGYAELTDDTLRLRGLVGSPDGIKLLVGEVEKSINDTKDIGTSLADELLKKGAAKILNDLHG